ncbi:MAG TPA: tRNA lysidine(34) synthetase TilS [Solirubrobacteraceae bacterium]
MSLEARVRAGGLLGEPVAVLLSGGRDSVCLLDLAARISPDAIALHVNYGLRAEADGDEAFCRELCARLRVPLTVRRAGPPEGNVQAWARALRYAEAERLGRTVATGHTATDQVETVLYRLATSPGRRALLGMPARRGALVRPLLAFTRAQTAAYCTERGLPWREDASNALSARGRLRADVLPVLRALHPAAEANALRTIELLRDEAEVLDASVDALPAELDALAAAPPALARLALQRLADEAAGGFAPAVGEHLAAVLALRRQGTAAHDLPGGLRAVAEYGRLRVERHDAGGRPPAPVELAVPGRAAWGAGTVICELGDGPLDAAALARTLQVRTWRPGDRMRLRGGSRSLQDLFTDHKVPRARRARVPVVLSGDEIAWVPGVAAGERFVAGARTRQRVRLAWLADSAAP